MCLRAPQIKRQKKRMGRNRGVVKGCRRNAAGHEIGVCWGPRMSLMSVLQEALLQRVTGGALWSLPRPPPTPTHMVAMCLVQNTGEVLAKGGIIEGAACMIQ
eukprot:scaffold24798_cov21-Tisochrysis_lutea.AAC.2